MSSNESYHNNIGHPVPRVTVRELSSPDDIASCGTPSPPSHPSAPRLSPQHTGDNNDIDDNVSLIPAEGSVAPSAENLGLAFNRDYEVGASGEIKAVGSDMSLLPIEVELIEAERARDRDRAFVRALSEAYQAGPSSGYAGGAPQDHTGAHGHRCAWHGLSIAATRTSDASVPDGCECRESESNRIIGDAAAAASSVSRRPSAARVHTNHTSSSLGGFSITQHVLGSRAGNAYHPNNLDWSADSLATIGGASPYNPQRYLDGPFPFHIHQSVRPGDAAAQELSAWELERQRQANAPTERDSLDSLQSLEPRPDGISIAGTAMPVRVVTPSVISIHSISPPASVYNGVPKSTFIIDNSSVDEHLSNVRAPGGVTGYDSSGANRTRGRQRRNSSTHHSFSSLSHFAHLTVDTSLRTKICCLIILCIFLGLSATVLWLMSIKRMPLPAGIFCLFLLGAATLKLGCECLRAFELKKGEVSDLERSVGVGQKNVASLI